MDNWLDIMKEYVLVPREEYDNFIVLRAFADRAAKRNEDVLEQGKRIYEALVKNVDSNDRLLDLLFRKNRMECDSRAEQTNVNSGYFGFSGDAVEFLKEIGYTVPRLVEYINKRWDEKEGEMRKVNQ